jgi:phosphohistidine phosphatase
MKRLFLLRHGKAVPAEPGMDDADRPLLLRGAEDAAAVAHYMRRTAYAPDLILCSAAARAAQTAELVRKELGAPLEYRDALYLAAAAKLLALVRAAPAEISGLMLVGHNPGLKEVAALLAGGPVGRKQRARGDEEEKFPPAALAILDFDVKRWRDVAPGGGVPAAFVRPKDL